MTGKDKSVKVDAEDANQQQGQLTPPVTAGNPRTQPPSLPSAPTYSMMAPPTAAPEWLPPPLAYSSGAAAGSSEQDGDDDGSLTDDTIRLLPRVGVVSPLGLDYSNINVQT